MELRCKVERNGAFTPTLFDGDTPKKSWERGRFEGRKLDALARGCGVASEWLLGQLYRSLDGTAPGDLVTIALPVTLPESAIDVSVRGIHEVDDLAHVYKGADSFRDALAHLTVSAAEPLLYWPGTDRLCAVDADFHRFPYDARPSEQYLAGRLAGFQPVPTALWVTHGRGIRLIYVAQGGFTADELASVAAVRLIQIEPTATIELKRITRHPGYPDSLGRRCSPVEWRNQSHDLGAVRSWCAGNEEVNEEEVSCWLEARGFERGSRYEHERCPVDPETPSHGSPVVVYPHGIYCHGCAGHGVRRGTRTPGWFPYAIFCGAPSQSIISRCVASFTHWAHAKVVLACVHPLPEPILRGAYGALLKHTHGTDPRIASVFAAGKGIVRYPNRWGTEDGRTYKHKGNPDAILANLPACQYIADGKVCVDAERVARFTQNWDLTEYGYPHLNPVWGLRIYGHFLEPMYPFTKVLHARSAGEEPRYVVQDQRMSEEQAWFLLEKAFPGLSRPAVELLVAAKGCAEADGTFPPLLFITGQTAAGKSTSVVVAASIAGDRVVSVPLVSNDERLRAAVMEGKEKGSYVVFNEAVKEGAKAQLGKAEAMEFCLSLTPDSISHKLYLGPVEMGPLPVLVWTDTYIPQEVKQHAQIARRVIHVHLPSRVEWSRAMRETGLGKAEWLRMNREYAQACDCVLSSVIDRFFKQPHTFEEIAEKLGFYTLAHSDEAQLLHHELRTFFQLVGLATKDPDGWVAIDANAAGALPDLWRDLADPGLRSSQRCSEVDWCALTGQTGPIRFCVTGRGAKVKVKFDGADFLNHPAHMDCDYSAPFPN